LAFVPFGTSGTQQGTPQNLNRASPFTSGATAQAQGGSVGGVSIGAPSSPQTIQNNLSSLQSVSTMLYPTADFPKYYMRFQINQYSRAGLLEVGPLNEIGNIFLPLSQVMVDALNVEYDQKALGTFTGEMVNIAQKVREGLHMGSGATLDPGNSRNAVSSSASVNDSLQSLLRQGAAFAPNVGGINFGEAAQAFFGIAPNQFLTILLQGPKYKMFEFQWKFSPNTPQDAIQLGRVIRMFQRQMSPSIAPSGAVWGYPAIWRIGILPNPLQMYKFKPAVLTTFTANYAPEGQPAFYRPDPATNNVGSPVIVDVSARFIEIEYWLTNDFSEVNDPWDASQHGNTPSSINPNPQ